MPKKYVSQNENNNSKRERGHRERGGVDRGRGKEIQIEAENPQYQIPFKKR